VRVDCRDLVLPLHTSELRLDFSIEAKALGLHGPSGAGKTTLIETIAGLRRPLRGAVTIDGRQPRSFRFGYVPQDETLFPHLSVRANIAYGMHRSARGMPKAAHASQSTPSHDALLEIAERLAITPLLDRGVQRLSGGERRRAAIARAILSSPEIVLLDEPLAGLDAPLRERTLALIAEFKPLIFVSHDLCELREVCDEILEMPRA
jgi:molybdate transport system ATP-binding protein